MFHDQARAHHAVDHQPGDDHEHDRLRTGTILARSASLAAGVDTGAKILETVSAACRVMLSMRWPPAKNVVCRTVWTASHSAFSGETTASRVPLLKAFNSKR